MEIRFWDLSFEVKNKKVFWKKVGNLSNQEGGLFVEVQISGENKDSHLGVKMVNSSEEKKLFYVSHKQTEDFLEIVQRSRLVEVKTVFCKYSDTNAVQVHTEIKNISDCEITLEEVSALALTGIFKKTENSAEDLYFTRFIQSHHTECQPKRYSFEELGLFSAPSIGQKRIAFANVGSWSTKEELPQAIVENKKENSFFMFQIESNSTWYYEISDQADEYYLYLGGGNLPFGGWSKPLKPQESYQTVNVVLTFGNSENQVVGEMTKYRRHIARYSIVDKDLPTVFNEYMHLSWDSPTEENTKRIAPIVAQTGIDYYVIDCGWHNEEDGDKVYPYIGQWKESKARFPHGIRATTDFIRSLGMKAGLWIEPEVIGIQCVEMLNYYDEDCFLQRNGKRLAVMGRHFLDFRAKKVVDYMTETIRRMVEDYGADYIKFDYNQDCGVGTDYLSFCAGEGLEQCADAFLCWTKDMVQRFPDVIFEGCASGGMRLDYKTMSVFNLASTSDQTDYIKYPYIVGNILSAVLPEQAGVWSYPVGVGEVGKPLTYDAEWVKENITTDRIAMNMINSFLGRMHLSSHLELLNENQFALVKEGVEYYKKLSTVKREALPYFPLGFSKWGEKQIVAGLKTADTVYLSAWCLSEEKQVRFSIETEAKNVLLAYPKKSDVKVAYLGKSISLTFTSPQQAVFLEIKV